MGCVWAFPMGSLTSALGSRQRKSLRNGWNGLCRFAEGLFMGRENGGYGKHPSWKGGLSSLVLDWLVVTVRWA